MILSNDQSNPVPPDDLEGGNPSTIRSYRMPSHVPSSSSNRPSRRTDGNNGVVHTAASNDDGAQDIKRRRRDEGKQDDDKEITIEFYDEASSSCSSEFLSPLEVPNPDYPEASADTFDDCRHFELHREAQSNSLFPHSSPRTQSTYASSQRSFSNLQPQGIQTSTHSDPSYMRGSAMDCRPDYPRQRHQQRRFSPLSKVNSDFLRLSTRHSLSLSVTSDADDDSICDEDPDEEVKLPEFPVFLSLIGFLTIFVGCCYVLPAFLLDDVKVLNPLTSDIQFEMYVVGTSTLPVGVFLLAAAIDLQGGGLLAEPASVKESDSCIRRCRVALRTYLRALRTPILLFIAVVNYHFKEMAVKIVQEKFQTTTTNLLDRAQAITMYVVLYSFLEDIKLLAEQYADRLDRCAMESKKSQKWVSIMKSFSRFKDYEVDKSYVIPGGSRSPSRVLAEIVAVYCGIGKAFALIILVLYLVGVDVTTNLVVLGLTVAFATVIQALHVNEALQNVLPLAMSNAFHVGEIISVSRTGGAPADQPAEFLSGFVEGVTWGHVIIRDFRKKQVFIPHSSLHGMQISNWARRPSKLCRFVLPVAPAFSGGAEPLAQLAKYGRKWIQEHPEIDTEGYTKCAIRYRDHTGLALEVIFYPKPGNKATNIKAEFILMIVEAAKRLNICLTKTEARLSTGWEHRDDSDGARRDDFENIDYVLQDLMPSPQFTRRTGYEPKLKRL